MSERYGYVRVSTTDQCIDRQIDAMLKLGVSKDNIFIDKASGKNFNRPQYQRMLSLIKKGDTLLIQSLDRLGRSFEEVPLEYNRLTRTIGLHIRVIGMELLDSDRAKSRNEKFVHQLLLMIEAWFAENERMAMLERQQQGFAAARLRGKKFGRPEVVVSKNFLVTIDQWRKGLIGGRDAAKRCGMARSTFFRKAKQVGVTV